MSKPPELETYAIPDLGITIQAPTGLTLESDDTYDGWAKLTGKDFELRINAFVPEGSSQSAAETMQQIEALNGTLIMITHQEDHGSSWRIDYAMPDGRCGTSIRIGMLDCGIGGVSKEQRDLVATCCQSIKPLR